MTDWQVEFLEGCLGREGGLLGEGAFAPGPAVWMGKREIAHFDDERSLDIRITRGVIRERRDELKGDARVSLRSGSSDWMAVDLADEDDVPWARELVRLAIVANSGSAPPGIPPTGSDLERRRRFH